MRGPAQVIEIISTEAVPLLKRCSLAGHAELKTHNPLFVDHPRASDMLIDILTDRGFSVAHTIDEHVVPVWLRHASMHAVSCLQFPCVQTSCLARTLPARMPWAARKDLQGQGSLTAD